MAAPGGPDEETWSKMSPRAKRIYWVAVGTVMVIILCLFIWHIFNPLSD